VHIDVHTLAIILSLSNLMQVGALFIQYRVDKTHAGPGWWTLGSASLALGFAFNYLRDAPAVAPIAIIGNNLLFLAGASLLYVGVLRFLGRTEPRAMLVVLFAIVSAAIVYFTFVQDNVPARRVIISIALVLVSVLIAVALLAHRSRQAAASCYFLTTVFLGHSVFLVSRALTPLSGPQVEAIFSSSNSQVATYISALIATTLWTFGFILMVNQRLNAERQETIEELHGAMEQIRTLRGILPICSHCKKIRDDRGFWEQVDAYVSRHTEAEFSHGICPDCMQARYPKYHRKG
jgi:hypothetical protein